MRIGFVNRSDAHDIRSWSGTLYFMAKALEKHAGEVVYLGPDTSFSSRFIRNNIHRFNRVHRLFLGKPLVGDQNRLLSRSVGRFFEGRLREESCDILFAPSASIETAHLKTRIPIVYFSDLTWETYVDYYPDYCSLSSVARREGALLESAAISRAAALVYPSDWAASSARTHYSGAAEKTYRVHLGANLQEIPPREAALCHPIGNIINLLWIGVDWERKGGQIAFDCMKSLLAMGVSAQLTICGAIPPEHVSHPRVQVIPFLDKRFPENRRKLSELFLDAHFLLFPTRAEAAGIVMCEASAHGTPVLVCNTGGVAGVLNDGINGFLMPFQAVGGDYAQKVMELVRDPAQYKCLVETSRDEFERYLNWDSWGRSIRSVMEDVLRRQSERRERGSTS